MGTLAEAQAILDEREKPQKDSNLSQASDILKQREAEEPSNLQKAGQFVSNMFTGNDRETQATEALPELPFSGILSGEDPATVAKIAPALMTALDPAEQAEILRANIPSIGIQQDEKGNLIAGNNRNGVKAILNKPGVSTQDVLQGAGLTAEFFPAAKLGAGASNVLKKMFKVGAGTGLTETANQALQAGAGGEFNLEDVAIATGGGAAFEGVFQGLAAAFPVMRESIKATGGKITDTIRSQFKQQAVKQGRNADEVTDDLIAQTLFPETAALEGDKEFGISLTKGQRTGRQADLQVEDDLLTGRVGTPKSQETMVARRGETQTQAQEAAGTIQQGLGREGVTIASQQEAGGLATQGIRNAEIAANQAVRESFETVGDAALKPDAFIKLFESTKNAIRGIDFPVTSETPATNALLKQINSAQKFFRTKGIELKSQHIQRVEQIRRSINAQVRTAANPTDKRNLTTMLRSYDDFLDEAVKKSLFEGDQTSLDALKSSRSLFKEYANKFRANPKKTRSGGRLTDREGKAVELIIEGNPTDIQVINSLFGTGNTFGNAAAKNTAVRFKSILGTESPEWGAIRQAGFKRLIRTGSDGQTISGRQTQKALTDAIGKNGELMRELYTDSEIALFQRFVAQVVRSQPDIIKGTANPSGTGKIVNKGLADLTEKLSSVIGFSTGNPVLIAAGQGVRVGSGFGAEKTAREAVRPFSKIINARPIPVAASTALTLQGSE